MPIFTQIKAIVIGLGLVFFFLFPVALICLPLPLRIRLKIIGPAWSIFGKLLLVYGCEVKIKISQDDRSQQFKKVPPYGLYVANHQSFLDIPLILTMYQAPPIMKREVLFIPVFGLIGLASGAIPVRRGDARSRKKVFLRAKQRILEEKVGLQFYPEGTRSTNATPKSFEEIKKTLLHFAYEENIPVIPTSLFGTRGILNSRGMIKTGREVGIMVKKEMLPSDYPDQEEFARAVWEEVLKGYEELKNHLERPSHPESAIEKF